MASRSVDTTSYDAARRLRRRAANPRVSGDVLFLFSFLCYYPWHMEFIRSFVLPILPYIQIILSVLLVTAILLQQRGSSLGGAFGGDNFSAAFNKRRGSELFLFRVSIGVAVLFVLSALLNIAA